MLAQHPCAVTLTTAAAEQEHGAYRNGNLLIHLGTHLTQEVTELILIDLRNKPDEIL